MVQLPKVSKMGANNQFFDEVGKGFDRDPLPPPVAAAPTNPTPNPREAHLAHAKHFEREYELIWNQVTDAGLGKSLSPEKLGQLVAHLAEAKAILADHGIGEGKKFVLQ